MPTPEIRVQAPAAGLVPRYAAALVTALALLVALLAAAPARAQQEDKALGRPATASSVERARPGGECNERKCAPGMATDGDPDTRWESEYTDTEWWQVDLGAARQVDQVSLLWHIARAEAYVISTSLDGATFTDAAEVSLDLSADELAAVSRSRRHRRTTTFPARPARYVRVTSRERAPITVGGRIRLFGVSFWQASVFGPPDGVPAAPAGQPAAPAPAGAPAPGAGPAPAPAPAPSRPAAGTPFDSPSGSTSPPAGQTPAPPDSAAPGEPRQVFPFPIIRIKGAATASGAAIQLLSVRAPRAATVRVSCRGRGCPKRIRSRKGTGRIRELQRRLRAGAVIDVAVTQAGRYGKHTRFVVRKRKGPRRIDRCTFGASARPIPCPAG
jgi:hypothetical protein